LANTLQLLAKGRIILHEQIQIPASPLLDGIKEFRSFVVTIGTILIIAGMVALL